MFWTPYQRKSMLDLGHEKVVACDAIFGTNDKKVFSPISSLVFHILQDQHGLPNY
jgi:hypothetical protein